jgi:nucleoside-diphosphate kinase
MADQRTLTFVKPDGVQRRLVGEIIGRFERRGLKILGIKMMRVSRELAERHYGEHKGKKFYDGLVSFVTSGPIVALCVEGNEAISVVRAMMGKTFSYESAPGTIRGDFGVSKSFNLIHGSDSPEAAAREIELYFKPDELVSYEMPDAKWSVGGE